MDAETRLRALEQQLSRLQARDDIWLTITRYARGIDEQRFDELEDVFTDDVVSQTHPWSPRVLVGKPLVLKAFRNYLQAFQNPRRFITNEQLQVHDDGTATGYANWFVVQSHAGEAYYGWGWYEWEFRAEAGHWRICKMIIHVECMTTLARGWGMAENRVVPFPARAQRS